MEKNIILVHQHEGGEGLEEDIESENLEYAITKDKIRKLAKEIAAVRKKATQEKGKGKHKIILSESENEDELVAMAIHIIEDDVVNKVPIEMQFRYFFESRAK